MPDLIEVKRFYSRHEAEMAKGLLQDEDIFSLVSADDAGGYQPNLMLSMKGARLMVRKEDFSRAREVLKVLEGLGE
ncbi:MAG: hypothetical protein GF375_03710 [Candidatus Omnitrophica bacterium]|nr:hypothetical protein [Candidatus Omnitrophota bacterium]MBD3269167.1 hypothetical protein [Candidatus Omnitrophota bacterium]